MPSVALEPFRKWPSEESWARSRFSLCGVLVYGRRREQEVCESWKRFMGSRANARRHATHMCDLQVVVHLLECLLGLGEEIVDDGFGELALLLVIVHL